MVVMTHCLFQAFPATKLKTEKGYVKSKVKTAKFGDFQHDFWGQNQRRNEDPRGPYADHTKTWHHRGYEARHLAPSFLAQQ